VKLITRISFFFLTSLAVVLLGFSVSIFILVHTHLMYQLDDRVDDALDILNGAVEAGPGGLEWDADERKLPIALSNVNEPLVWAVFDDTGQRLAGSSDETAQAVITSVRGDNPNQQEEQRTWNGATWRVLRRYLRADDHGRGRIKGVPAEEESKAKYYPALTLAVGTPLTHVMGQLRLLAIALIGISVLIWLVAAFLGRWLCLKALAPLTRMSNSISSISAADLSQRLPEVNTDDQLEELSRAFNELLTRLQISFERQRRFAAEASHQLRTPLTAMLGQLDVALRRDREVDEYRGTITSAHEQATRLKQIAEMLLFLTREEAEAALPDFESLDLNDWLSSHTATWKAHPRFSDLHHHLDATIPLWIRAHKGLLGQVVDNLLDNACKYSDPGSVIVLRTRRRGDNLELEVDDSGYGIPENEINRVFDPFFRSMDAQRRGIQGAGLGLSIVQRIVLAFNATLEIDSRVGRGSRFIVIFPSMAAEQLQSA
jgi:two-component system OmpR family sensor kinase